MISEKLKKITFLSLLLIYAHGLEEIIMGFWKFDSVLMTFNNNLQTIPQAVYYASHIPWWLVLIPMFLLILGGKWTLRVMILFGIVFIIELHHLFGALISQTYYPGMITAFFYPIVGFFYWKELIRNLKHSAK